MNPPLLQKLPGNPLRAMEERILYEAECLPRKPQDVWAEEEEEEQEVSSSIDEGVESEEDEFFDCDEEFDLEEELSAAAKDSSFDFQAERDEDEGFGSLGLNSPVPIPQMLLQRVQS